jgi:hypothetical protein
VTRLPRAAAPAVEVALALAYGEVEVRVLPWAGQRAARFVRDERVLERARLVDDRIVTKCEGRRALPATEVL